MSQLKLIQLYDTKAVLKNWHFFVEGLEAVLAYTDNLTIDNIFNGIMGGRILLWVGFVDNKYSGFCTTRVEQAAERCMWIENVYIMPGVQRDIFFKACAELDKYMLEMKCDSVRFATKREKAFERKLKDMDWKQEAVIFQRRVNK